MINVNYFSLRRQSGFPSSGLGLFPVPVLL